MSHSCFKETRETVERTLVSGRRMEISSQPYHGQVTQSLGHPSPYLIQGCQVSLPMIILYGSVIVMVDSVGQCDWAKGCPGSW